MECSAAAEMFGCLFDDDQGIPGRNVVFQQKAGVRRPVINNISNNNNCGCMCLYP